MIVYKLYWRDREEEEHFIGMLPEKRNNHERITEESLTNMTKAFLGNNTGLDLNEIYIVQSEM